MNSTNPPQLNVPAGAQFGHRSRLPFGKNHRVLVNAATEMTVGPGLHLLVAPNGSGKTTLLRTLAGLHPALHGRPSIKGRVHYVSDELKMDPELKPLSLFDAWFTNAALTHAHELAEKFKLNVRCAIGKHSRGNRQKVLLIVAEALAAHAGSTVLLMDEPFTGLDSGTRETVAAHWASTPAILRLVVLHELESVGQADSLFTIAKGTLHHTRERKGALLGGNLLHPLLFMKSENRWPLFRICTAGLAVRGSCWLLLGGIIAFAWAAPLLTPWQENPKILQPARAQAAWMYVWIALATWLPFQAAALGRRLRADGLLEFQRARGAGPFSIWMQICASVLVWMLAVTAIACVICLTVCLPKHPDEAWLWLGLVLQYATLFTLVATPLVLLGVALGTCAGEVIAFLVPAFLLFTGLVAATWMEPVLTGSNSVVHRLAWLALPHYHLADLTPRLVFKMGPLPQADFLGSVTCLALQGVAITFTGLCMFRTRS